MTLPIFIDRDISKPIGIIRNEDGKILFEFHEDVEITREMMFGIFGNAGIMVTEAQRDNDNIIIKSGEILEFSFSNVSSIQTR